MGQNAYKALLELRNAAVEHAANIETERGKTNKWKAEEPRIIQNSQKPPTAG